MVSPKSSRVGVVPYLQHTPTNIASVTAEEVLHVIAVDWEPTVIAKLPTDGPYPSQTAEIYPPYLG
jgi:hypothetical protein